MNVSLPQQFERAACPLGCSEDDTIVLDGGDRLHGLPGRFLVVECRQCGLRRTNPRPTPAAIGDYYPQEYRLHAPAKPPVAPKKRSLPRRLLSKAIDFRTKTLPDMQPGFLYEVGCGNGAFLANKRAEGWRVEGLELAPQGVQSARALGLTVTQAPLEEAAAPAEAPDLVVAWMVLEHLHEPVKALQKLAEWSQPGAWLVASVPNAAGYEMKAFRDAWYALQVPTHLYHYTPNSLDKVLGASGWRMERVFHHRNLNNLVSSLGYKLGDAGFDDLGQRLQTFPAWATWQQLALYPAATAMAALGQTGRMTIWARKAA